ncbi:MAG: SIS domain-containing protein [Sedimenticola sp.]
MDYFQHIQKLHDQLRSVIATGPDGSETGMDEAMRIGIDMIGSVNRNNGKVMIIGNGGSAAIASHLSIDLARNGGVPAMTFNEATSLTCFGNDFGYEHVFSHQVALNGDKNDLLIAISSSGASENILNAVAKARSRGCSVMTLSGFRSDNPLRSKGDLNYYVSSDHYGRVELSHMTLCHALIDMSGDSWSKEHV